MKITVLVKPRSKKESLEKLSENTYQVRVRAAPIDGKANDAVTKALAKHFKVPRSAVVLLHGEKSKTKIFQITMNH